MPIDSPELETTTVHSATVGLLLPFLKQSIPWIWIIGHIPNTKYEWWRTQVPVSADGSMIDGDVRLWQYDLQLATDDFLLAASAFEGSGINLIQSRQRMPATLDLQRKIANRTQVLRMNGAFISIDLPHANETAVVTCWEPAYFKDPVSQMSAAP